jgi:hypothetical protein
MAIDPTETESVSSLRISRETNANNIAGVPDIHFDRREKSAQFDALV